MLKSAGDLSAFPSAYPGVTYCQDLDFTACHRVFLVPCCPDQRPHWSTQLFSSTACTQLQFASISEWGNEWGGALRTSMLVHGHVLLRSWAQAQDVRAKELINDKLSSRIWYWGTTTLKVLLEKSNTRHASGWVISGRLTSNKQHWDYSELKICSQIIF